MKNAKLPIDEMRAEYLREDLGKGVRGKYAARYAQASNVVVIDPALTKAFPNSEAVNEALRGLLALATSVTRLTARPKQPARKRAGGQP
jgi:hypothetical protein